MVGKREEKKKRLWLWPLTIVFAAVLVAVMPSTPDSPHINEVMPPVVEPSVAEPSVAPSVAEEPVEVPTEEPEPEVPAGPVWQVPESEAREDSYFDDAVFIGDSRMEGFELYAGLNNAKYLTSVGVLVNQLFTKATERLPSGEKVPILDALAQMEFGKVYLMLGVNELGWPDANYFKNQYSALIDRIREINPDAIIYIEEILPVSAKRNAKGDYVNNERIVLHNELLRQLAEEKGVWYLEVSQVVTDETGCLKAESTPDGVHLKPAACKDWLAYIKTHTVDPVA